MSFQELELAVGDAVQIGDYTLTVIDLENGEVTFRIQQPPADEPVETPAAPRPR